MLMYKSYKNPNQFGVYSYLTVNWPGAYLSITDDSFDTFERIIVIEEKGDIQKSLPFICLRM